MSRSDDLERQFRRLHDESVRDFDNMLRRTAEADQRRLAEQQTHFRDEVQRVARLLEVSVETIERSEVDGAPQLEEHIAEVRSTLVDRDSHRASDAKRLALHQGLAIPGARIVPVYASSVMAANAQELADIPGEHGNPWVLPANPDQVRIKDELYDTQYGLCGLAQAYRPPHTWTVYFAFIAEATSMWNFMILADFHGFYLLNATRNFFLCRDSRVTLDVSINAGQYFWFGNRSTRLLDEESTAGFRYGLYDQSTQFDYRCPLRADPQYYVFVTMEITVTATAYHGYSQINFADGANYIDPLLLIAWPG